MRNRDNGVLCNGNSSAPPLQPTIRKARGRNFRRIALSTPVPGTLFILFIISAHLSEPYAGKVRRSKDVGIVFEAPIQI